jgi:multidrug efflux pump subunit AcrB
VVDVADGVVLAGDALSVTVDREKAAVEGVDPESVSATLEAAVTGAVTTAIQRTPKMVWVRVGLPRGDRDRASRLAALRIRAPDGHLFPLGRVATLTTVTGQPQIDRNDFKQMVAVTGRISGRDMGSTVADVEAALAKDGLLPAGVYYHLGGLYEQQREAFRGLALVFAGAVALVFFLLLFLYESFRVAAAMLTTTLLAVAAVFIGLWLTGTELNINAMMGMTMVIGIVTEVSIFYYSELAELGAVRDPVARAITAGTNRMRPILMTTLAAILALLPLVLDQGQGAAMQRPLAIAIISGLAVQVPLVLTVLPALLALTRGLDRGDASAAS